jgi:hypothetical protein
MFAGFDPACSIFGGQVGMSHDTFISYRRSDVKISDTVHHILRSAGFSPYRDVDDLAGGYCWQDQIREVLSQSNPKPYVLILCTDDAVAKSDRILEELEIAKDNDLIIVALEFDEGAAEKLLMRAGLPYARSNHYIRNCREKLVGNGLEDALRRTLTHHILRSVRQEKDSVRRWVDARLPLSSRASFWTDQIRSYFQTDDRTDRLDSVALIARGGSGKSTLIAQFLKHHLDSPKTFPILISEADLRDLSQLAKKLGARSLTQFPEHVNWLSREPVEAASGWRPIRRVRHHGAP